jgi:hypothetical protein
VKFSRQADKDLQLYNHGHEKIEPLRGSLSNYILYEIIAVSVQTEWKSISHVHSPEAILVEFVADEGRVMCWK